LKGLNPPKFQARCKFASAHDGEWPMRNSNDSSNRYISLLQRVGVKVQFRISMREMENLGSV